MMEMVVDCLRSDSDLAIDYEKMDCQQKEIPLAGEFSILVPKDPGF